MLRDFNWKSLIAVGLLAGLIQVAAGIIMYVFRIYFLPWSWAISLGVLLLCIVFLTPPYSKFALKGHLSYRQALIIGIAMSFCTGIVYAVYNLISISYFYPNFVERVIDARVAVLPASQRTPEVIAALREGTTAKTIALSNLLRLSLFGSFLSVFVANVLKDKNQK